MNESWWVVLEPGALPRGPLSLAQARVAVDSAYTEHGGNGADPLVWHPTLTEWRAGRIALRAGLAFDDGRSQCDSEQNSDRKAAERSAAAARTDDAEHAVRRAEMRVEVRRKKERQRLKRKLEDATRCSVYVMGLADDVSDEELAQLFAKYGVLRLNERGRPKIKRYVNDDGSLKGDALVTYAFPASVDNAVMLLDGCELRADRDDGRRQIRVERAEFVAPTVVQLDAMLAERRCKRATTGPDSAGGRNGVNSGRVGRERVQQLVGWDEAQQLRALRVVILKHVFDLSEVDALPDEAACRAFYSEVREDLWAECQRIADAAPSTGSENSRARGGPLRAVENVTVFEGTAEGVAAVRFRHSSDARVCIEVMNGRWLDGRKISAEYFDGITDYRIRSVSRTATATATATAETNATHTADSDIDEAERCRDKEWEQWLLSGRDAGSSSSSEESCDDEHEAAI